MAATAPPPPPPLPPSPGPWNPASGLPYMPMPPTNPNAPGTPAIRETELKGLGALRMAAILGIVGLLLGLFVPYGLSLAGATPNPFGAYSVVTPGSGANNTTITVNAGAAWTLVGVLSVGIVIGLIGLIFYRQSFATLRSVESGLSTPATLTIVLMVGIILALVGVVLVFNALIGASGCILRPAASTAQLSSCATSLVSAILLGVGLLFLSIILIIVGVIGLVLGIWRIGGRYDSTLLKVAAILYIIPFANVVGSILTLIEVGRIEGQLRGGGMPPPTGPSPPPVLYSAPAVPPPPGR